uniref:50S ribosomal protein L11 n=1 Tax=Nephromyces sp. ex Molgula occidentalis TaxID=2544991 RepID=A0A5C1H9K2_9APIC|nr:50S ribosomal protein L11 [Nephromyces sp. ex Molgula occidentalis]
MSKKLLFTIKLNLSAGNTIPTSTLSSILGQYGINSVNFCKEYNKLTINNNGFIIPINLNIYSNKSYSFLLKTPTTSNLILKILKLKKGSVYPNKQFKGILNNKDINKIINIKKKDLYLLTRKQIKKIIFGTAQSLGVLY